MRNMKRIGQSNAAGALILAAALMVGCASSGAKKDLKTHAINSIATAESDIRSAREAGAQIHASSELSQAESLIASARARLQKKEYVKASELARSASLNAQAAKLKAEQRQKKPTPKKK